MVCGCCCEPTLGYEEQEYRASLVKYQTCSVLSAGAPVFTGASLAACIMVSIEATTHDHELIMIITSVLMILLSIVAPTCLAFIPKSSEEVAYWMEVTLETATFMFLRFGIVFVFLGKTDEGDRGEAVEQITATVFLVIISICIVGGLVCFHAWLLDRCVPATATEHEERHRIQHTLLEHRASVCALGPVVCMIVAVLNYVSAGDSAVALHDDVIAGHSDHSDDGAHHSDDEHESANQSLMSAFLTMCISTVVVTRLGEFGLFKFDPRPGDKVTTSLLQQPLLEGASGSGSDGGSGRGQGRGRRGSRGSRGLIRSPLLQ